MLCWMWSSLIYLAWINQWSFYIWMRTLLRTQVKLQWSKPVCIWMRASCLRCLPCFNFSALYRTWLISTSLHVACYWSVFMMLLLRGILGGASCKLSSERNLIRKWEFIELGMFHCKLFRCDRLSLKSGKKQPVFDSWWTVFWPEAWCFQGPWHGAELPRIAFCDRGHCVSRNIWFPWTACMSSLLQSQRLKKSLWTTSDLGAWNDLPYLHIETVSPLKSKTELQEKKICSIWQL